MDDINEEEGNTELDQYIVEFQKSTLQIQKIDKDLKKAIKDKSVALLDKILKEIESTPSIDKTLSDLKSIILFKINEIKSLFEDELKKRLTEEGYAFEYNYPDLIVILPDKTKVICKISDSFKTVTIDEKVIKNADVSIIIKYIKNQKASRSKIIYEDIDPPRFKNIVDHSYEIVASESGDNTVTLKKVLKVIENISNAVGLKVDSLKHFSKLYFMNLLDDYEFFKAGSADTLVNLEYGEHKDIRTMMKRKNRVVQKNG